MSEFKLGGHLEDPDDPRYWSFGLLKADGLDGVSGSVDLRPYSSTVHNQRSTASCVANAVAKALEIRERHHHASEGRVMHHTDISRLHLYYLSREMHRAQDRDAGTYISICCDVLKRFGLLPESRWPFDPKKIFVSPGWKEMRHSYSMKVGASGYYRIKSGGDNRVDDCIKALRSHHPVVFGTTVDQQWYRYQEGDVLREVKKSEGRHATALVGWDDSRGLFIGENSWGRSWGDEGCYLMDPEVIADRDSKDFWVIRGHWESAPLPD